jgi:hypothetical protein
LNRSGQRQPRELTYLSRNRYYLNDGGAPSGLCGDKNQLRNRVSPPFALVTHPLAV